MEKKENSTGMYETTCTGGFLVGKLSTPTTKKYLTDQTKEAVLEYLTESDEFHKLICDITGTQRKQVKVSPELEKLKEDYSHVCIRYKQEQQKSNDLLHLWKEETARRLNAEKKSESVARKHNFATEVIYEILREVGCTSVANMADQLKAERANGKLLAEDRELRRRLYGCDKNQAEMTADLVKEIELLKKDYQCQSDLAQKYREKSEKLQSKLDKASKRYGELIKTISDIAIK